MGVTEEKKEVADTKLSEVDALERRISNLEAVFKHLKEMKERKERGDVESSGSNF